MATSICPVFTEVNSGIADILASGLIGGPYAMLERNHGWVKCGEGTVEVPFARKSLSGDFVLWNSFWKTHVHFLTHFLSQQWCLNVVAGACGALKYPWSSDICLSSSYSFYASSLMASRILNIHCSRLITIIPNTKFVTPNILIQLSIMTLCLRMRTLSYSKWA